MLPGAQTRTKPSQTTTAETRTGGQAAFAYTDKAGKQRLTLTEPSATRDTYGWGTVTDVRKDLGVFLDVNIPEKDVVVSVDILPELKELWPKKRRFYFFFHISKSDLV